MQGQCSGTEHNTATTGIQTPAGLAVMQVTSRAQAAVARAQALRAAGRRSCCM